MKRLIFATDSVWTRAGASGIVVGIVVGVGVSMLASITPPAASADTSSAVTVAAKGYDLDIHTAPFPDLKVTVSQTKDLVSQGIVVNWTGSGAKSVRPDTSSGGQNFLQIAQCWGEDPLNPGHPDRTTCQYGGFPGKAASTRDTSVSDEFINAKDVEYTSPSNGFTIPAVTAIPYRASTGGTISSVFKNGAGVLTHYVLDPLTGLVQTATGTPSATGVTLPSPIVGVDLATNEFYTQYTTNEVPWVGSSDTGAGSVKFEVQTAMQSPGLGCGMPVTATDGTVTGKSCWLVVIPRGTNDVGESYITKSGLFWDAWQHSVAVKLDFKPIGLRCSIGSAEKQLSGSELASAAVASWQPNLCTGSTGSSFVLSTGNEEDSLLSASQKTPSPLALTSRALQTTKADPVQYAPIALSGLAVSFSIDRRVKPVGTVPQEYKDKNTESFTSMNLTPRLIAKLLTNSYLDSLPTGAPATSKSLAFFVDNPEKVNHNARNLSVDPDFLAVNDAEWQYQDLTGPSLGDMLLPSGRSDEALQLWRYVLSDPDAVAFLNGEADKWGMKVNPWYATKDAVNSSGTKMTVPRTNFPKADPIARVAKADGQTEVNLVTWRPYTSDFETGAYLTLRGDGQELGDWSPNTVPPKWGKSVRNLVGTQRVLGLTTTASAARYQTVTASLRNSAGAFVAANSASLLAAAAAMTPTTANKAVLEYDPTSSSAKAAASAYPMTMPVYAALNPLQTDSTARGIYANMIRYAVAAGQVPGAAIGQLPEGYASIPASWVAQALAAATAIEKGISPIVTANPTPTPTPTVAASVAAPAAAYVNPSAGSGTAAVAAVAAAVAGTAATDPAATGAAAGPLVGKPTPADPTIGPIPAAIPAGFLSGLLAAGGVPLISRIRRRS
ncbi:MULTISPECIES: hypothetical protein [unclassified Cryobacterium]|uniref:hypothetical protein n=3 Tax=Cryobacterium TaxID=69578 RepID=UPI002AB51BC7|nr:MULTISPECIES: hypothetical protein [unclassified Cryobacterium]MDY7542995.1 hypothetical protein [Cryobacterium sp. 5B3]MEA9999292.1 hypothetical protein [Cryobacterium sp. RTS3]MEB0274062.1 hypothetical protein [Cryobacterium sp. 5B3]